MIQCIGITVHPQAVHMKGSAWFFYKVNAWSRHLLCFDSQVICFVLTPECTDI